MSRLGKKGVTIPEKTEATFAAGVFSVKGPKGSLQRSFRPDISISIEGKQISLSVPKENNQTKALWGTYASHIKNMVKGVNDGFEKKLVLEGVGYKSQVTPARPDEFGHSGGGTKLVLALGFSHPVNVEIPVGLTVKAEKNLLTIMGIDKELVGSFAAEIRDLKKPEPYKGKGFHYSDEIVRRKQGKKSV